MGNGPAGLVRAGSSAPKGKGHTFKSCRVRQENTSRGCRDCGWSGPWPAFPLPEIRCFS